MIRLIAIGAAAGALVLVGCGDDDDDGGHPEERDGTLQITYNGHPLYYYVDDPRGEVLCQNVDEFGGLWLVVKPNGEPVRGG